MHYTCVWPSRFVIWAEEAMGALSDNWFVRVGEVPPVVLWSEGCWPTRRGLLSRRSASVAMGEVSSLAAVGRVLDGRLCSFR